MRRCRRSARRFAPLLALASAGDPRRRRPGSAALGGGGGWLALWRHQERPPYRGPCVRLCDLWIHKGMFRIRKGKHTPARCTAQTVLSRGGRCDAPDRPLTAPASQPGLYSRPALTALAPSGYRHGAAHGPVSPSSPRHRSVASPTTAESPL